MPFRRLDRIYQGRSRFELLRARAMAVVFAVGVVASFATLTNDMLFGQHAAWLHALTDVPLVLCVTAGLFLVLTGRDEAATLMVPVLVIVFSLGTVGAALDGRPDRFYTGWARWYPLFIIVNALFLSVRGAVAATGFALIWTIAYFPLFRGRLVADAPPMIPTDMVDQVFIELLCGVITVATVLFVRSAQRELEHTIEERTTAVRSALEERNIVLEYMKDGLISVASSGHVRVVNAQLGQLLGSDGLTTGTLESGSLPVRLLDLIQEARKTGEIAEATIEIDNRFVLVSATPIVDASGNTPGVVALARDVTVEREVDRLKTEFIATVSHELRTPMTSVLGFAKMIERQLRRNVAPALEQAEPRAQAGLERALDNVAIVVSEGERLTELINDVLDIAKMESGRMEWRHEQIKPEALVNKAADAVRGLFPEDGPVQLVVRVDPVPDILGDEHRLIQVLVNLLSNAAKFTDQGHVMLRAVPVDGGVELSVRDTGRGISEEALPRVFDRFRQVEDTLTDKPRGTGLGLPICRQIALAHGSDIHAESTPGKGSRFWMVLAPHPEA